MSPRAASHRGGHDGRRVVRAAGSCARSPAERPDVELMLDVGNRQEVLERVLDHTADVAISGRPPADDRLVAEPLMDNAIVCITAPGDPLTSGGPVASSATEERAWLLREPGSGTRALNLQFLDDHGVKPPTLTLGSNGAIKQAARAGLGVSLLSRVTVEAELAAGLLARAPARRILRRRPAVVRPALGGRPGARGRRGVRRLRQALAARRRGGRRRAIHRTLPNGRRRIAFDIYTAGQYVAQPEPPDRLGGHP